MDDDLGADLNQQEEEGDRDPETFVGSRGSRYGGESTMLYDQFQLHSSQKKNHQLILLKVEFIISTIALIHLPPFVGLRAQDKREI